MRVCDACARPTQPRGVERLLAGLAGAAAGQLERRDCADAAEEAYCMRVMVAAVVLADRTVRDPASLLFENS